MMMLYSSNSVVAACSYIYFKIISYEYLIKCDSFNVFVFFMHSVTVKSVDAKEMIR